MIISMSVYLYIHSFIRTVRPRQIRIDEEVWDRKLCDWVCVYNDFTDLSDRHRGYPKGRSAYDLFAFLMSSEIKP